MDELGEFIYRAMEEDNGLPKLGRSATKLAVRPGKDIVPDSQGLVHQPAFLPGEPNGLSCSPTVADLPGFALPLAWGGSNPRTEVWRIRIAALSSELMAQEDTEAGQARHVSIGPSRSMKFDDFAVVIEATQKSWQKV